MTEPTDVHGTKDAASRAVRDARLAWILGGSLLVANAALILVMSAPQLTIVQGASYLADALWAVALFIFAFGIRGAGSVVAKRPAGVAALLVSAVMPFVMAIVSHLLTPTLPTTVDLTYDPTLNITIIQSLQALSLAALAVACVVIAQAGAVPRRWRWLPLILLAVGALPQIIVTIAMVSITDPFAQLGVALALQGVAALGTLATLTLGIFAIVLAPREEPRSGDPVQVYPPAP